MSDNQLGHSFSSYSGESQINLLGEINHLNKLSEHFGALCMSFDYSDVMLVVEEQKIPAHRVVLAARSDYFRALLYNGMKESTQDQVEIQVSSLAAFKFLLKYVYTGHLQLGSLNDEMVSEIFGLAHQYGFTELEEDISNYLKKTLNINNICMIYDTATLYQLKHLVEVCCSFIDQHALEVIRHESFYSLSPATLKQMIRRDSFCAQEIDIFKAVKEWSARNPNEEIEDIISAIRLPLISNNDLLNVVRKSSLVSSDAILDAIQSKIESRDTDLKYRGCLIPEENVASKKYNTQVIAGENRDDLLNGKSSKADFDMEKGFARHHIDDNHGQGILLRLGMQCIINFIKLRLWDKDMRAYSYYIEVSIDGKDWVRVIDHTQYLCRSWQWLYFKPRVARYIRIVGTHNTVNRVFHLVYFECKYTNDKFEIENGLYVPKENVTSTAYHATVIEGVSRSRNTLINGDWKNYDWDSGYTCHQLGSGAIVVQLNQPYMVGSIRLLLWDTDKRSYSYYIEVSTDEQHWNMIVDKRNEHCQSWQTLTFPRQPVVFIRIVGTYNSANEVFHCVHLECPSQEACDNETNQSDVLKLEVRKHQVDDEIEDI